MAKRWVSSWICPMRENTAGTAWIPISRPSGWTRALVRCRSSFTMPKAGMSSAMASNLAKGYPLDAAVERAKAYISGCLSAMLDLGKGSGPMDHMFALRGEFVEH